MNQSSLDFWVGNWVVISEGKKDGDDLVEKLLEGAAIVEHWKGVAPGDEGKSFFYYMPERRQWKQIWVTKTAYKEKLSEPYPNGIRFSGTVFFPNGKQVHDRTTLIRLKDGGVRQVIEMSRDKKTWKLTYDAIYHRVAKEK